MTARGRASASRVGPDPIAAKAAFVLFIAILVLAPLPFGGNRPIAWSLLEAALGLALLLWTIGAVLKPERCLRVPLRRYLLPFCCMTVLTVWFSLQASTWLPMDWSHPAWTAAEAALGRSLDGSVSADPSQTRTALLRLLSYAAAFFLAMQFAASARRRRIMLIALALSGVGYATYGLVIQFGDYDTILWYPRWSYHDSLSATFVNRNSFATYAGLSLLVLLGLLSRQLELPERRRQSSDRGQLVNELATRLWPVVIGIILVFMALLLSQSRGGLLACLVALPLLPSYAAAHRRSFLIAGGAIAVILFVVLMLGGGGTLKRLEQDDSQSAMSRTAIYAAVLDGIAARPWLGHGYGTFETTFPAFRTPEMFKATRIVDKAHNSYLEFAFEAGLPATGAMAVLLVSLIWSCIATARRERHSATASRRAIAAAVLVGSHALVDFSVQIPAVAILFAALLGMGIGAPAGTAVEHREPGH